MCMCGCGWVWLCVDPPLISMTNIDSYPPSAVCCITHLYYGNSGAQSQYEYIYVCVCVLIYHPTHMHLSTHLRPLKELQENYHREKRAIAELGRDVSALLTNLGIADSSLEKVTTLKLDLWWLSMFLMGSTFKTVWGRGQKV